MSSINLKRKESLLKELLISAFSSIEELNDISIVDVELKNGKYDAMVFFDSSYLSKEDEKKIQLLLESLKKDISNYCIAQVSWFRFPNLKFMGVQSTQNMDRIDELFKKISKN